MFVILTEQRVILRAGKIEQAHFMNITGVDMDELCRPRLVASGNKLDWFYAGFGPPMDLNKKLLHVLNAHWLRVLDKRAKSQVAPAATNTDIISQIQHLNELRSKGILSSEEFIRLNQKLISQL